MFKNISYHGRRLEPTYLSITKTPMDLMLHFPIPRMLEKLEVLRSLSFLSNMLMQLGVCEQIPGFSGFPVA